MKSYNDIAKSIKHHLIMMWLNSIMKYLDDDMIELNY